MTNIKPLGKKLIVKRSPPSTQKSGILLLKKEPKNQGTVIAAGPDVEDVQPGDTVIWMTYSGSPITIDDNDLIVFNESDILGVMHD